MNWKTVKISSFLQERKERLKPSAANVLGLKRIEKIDFSGTYYLVSKLTNTDMIRVKKGDLLISGINAEKGAVTIFNEDEDALATIHYSAYKFDNSIIEIEYFRWFLKSVTFKNLLKKKSGNGIKTELKAKHLLPLEISLPTLEEQMGIVRMITSKHNILKEIDQEINKQQTYVFLLRKAILSKAVRGELTQQNKEAEQATDLLKRLKYEKQKLIKAGKIKKEKELPQLNQNELPYKLPTRWSWCRLQDITTLITDGKHGDSPNEQNSGYYFLSAKDIKDGKLNYENARQISYEGFLETHKRTDLKPGDICLVNTGATVGKIAIAPDTELTERTTFQKSVAVIKVLQQFINVNYLEIFLKSSASVLLKKSGGSAINNLLLGDLTKLLVPLPPHNEQQQIVEKVKKAEQGITQLEVQVQQSFQYALQLLQRILSDAFGNVDDYEIRLEKGKGKDPISLGFSINNTYKFNSMKILEILQQADAPLPAVTVWQKSEHKDDIEEFYAELKNLIDEEKSVTEEKIETESYLKLVKDEN